MLQKDAQNNVEKATMLPEKNNKKLEINFANRSPMMDFNIYKHTKEDTTKMRKIL